MNIIPRGPSLGEMLGQGLSDIATHFADRYSSTKALRALGFSDAQAKAYAHLGPQIQQQAVQSKLQEQQQQASNAAINQILGQGLPPVNFQQQSPMQALPPSTAPQMAQMQQARQAPQQNPIEQASSVLQNPAFQKLQKQAQDAQQLQQQQLAPKGQVTAPQALGALPGESQAIIANQLAQQKEPSIKDQIQQVRRQKQALAGANLPVQQRLALQNSLDSKEAQLRKEERDLRKESLEERKFDYQQRKEINKETLPIFKDINEKAKAAKDSDQRLNRIEELLNKGKVQDNFFIRSLEGLKHNKYFGAIAEGIQRLLTNKDTQEFEKLSSDFVKDAKQFFGSRITEAEVQLFLKTVPSLAQTNEGKKRVIRNMRIFNQAAGLRQKAMNQVIRDNGGQRPSNLEEQIEDRIGRQLDVLKAEFTQGPTIEQFSIKPGLNL